MAHDVFRVRGRGLRGPGLTSEQQASITRVQSAVLTVEDYGERFAKFPTPDYGDRVIVKNAFQVSGIWYAREFEWRKAGSLDLSGDPIAEDGWLGLRTPNEVANIENATEGVLPQDRVAGLVADLAALRDRADFARLGLASFSVSPSQAEVGDTITSLSFAWSVSGGVPNGQVIERSDGQRVWWLKGGDTSAIAIAAGAAPAGLLVVGDSQSYDKWEDDYAAALGLTLVRCAVYAQTSRKQALRVGGYDLALTLADNALPAAGSTGTVTAMNGGPTTIANPDAILHAHTGDTATHVIDGLLSVPGGTAHVRLTHAAGSSPDTVTIGRLDGGGAVTVTAGALFVPDFRAMLAGTHRVTIMVGHNSMSGSDPVGSFASIRADIDAIMALRGANKVQLFAIYPGDTETALIPHILAFNQWLRDKYPGAFALDAAGRDLYQRLLASGNPTGQDATDRAAGRIPTSLQADDLHLNSAGNAVWTAFAGEDNSLHLAGVVPITATVSFTAKIRGAVPGYPAVEETRSVTFPFPHRRFWGVSGSATLNSAGVVGLGGSDLSSARGKEFGATATDQYVYYAYPAALGDHSLYKLYGVDETPVETTVSVTKANGAAVSYTVLRSPLKQTGSVSVEVQ